MISMYVFEGRIARTARRYLIYPPKEYQEKLHVKKVKVIVIEEID